MEKGFIAIKVDTTDPRFVRVEVIKVNKQGTVTAIKGHTIPSRKRTTIHLNKKTLKIFNETDDYNDSIGQDEDLPEIA